jgi:hypothetical protein
MNSDLPIDRGERALRRLLEHATYDVRALAPGSFAGWLEMHLARWRGDPVFVQRERIRDLRRANPRLLQLEREQRRAAESERRSPAAERLRRSEKALHDAGRAVQGLTAALHAAPAERRQALETKREWFTERQERLRCTHATLLAASAERRALDHVAAQVAHLREQTGVEAEEARLRTMLRDGGRRAGAAGSRFEDLALHVTERCILPELVATGAAAARHEVHVLRGVTLGAARMELDQLLVRQVGDATEPVEVLAVVEVKRNINDLAHGFRLRQQNLAWLTGDRTRYDPGQHRTRSFPSGHFDRNAAHEVGGRRWVVGPDSFGRFRHPDPVAIGLDRLFFITAPGHVWGLSSASLARLGRRVTTDPRWDPDSRTYLRKFHRWCLDLCAPLETPDVLNFYARNEARANAILLASRGPLPDPSSANDVP